MIAIIWEVDTERDSTQITPMQLMQKLTDAGKKDILLKNNKKTGKIARFLLAYFCFIVVLFLLYVVV